jgi:hypothetical protein
MVDENIIPPEPLSKGEIEEISSGILKHPAFKLFADDKIMKVIFGDIEWPTEFDQYVIENPTNADEAIVSQIAWLAKASAYILMRLKRWVEMGAEKEVEQFYKTYNKPFMYQMSAINITCGYILDILPARLPTYEQRFREQYEKILSVAQKADKEQDNKLGTGISSFKSAARDLHGTVSMIHSEACMELEKLTKQTSGKAGKTETGGNAAPATIINIDKINKLGVLGNVQAENVQTGDYSSIHKQPTMDKKAEKWYRNRTIQAAFITTITFILLTILGLFLNYYYFRANLAEKNGNPKIQAPRMHQSK